MVWKFLKTGFLDLYCKGRGSLLLDRFLSSQKRQCRRSKGVFLPRRSVPVVKDFLLSSKTIPPGSSDGDAPRWSVMESKVWNESRLVLNCILWDHCTGYWIIVHTHVVLGTGSGPLYSGGWNMQTAIQRCPLRPPLPSSEASPPLINI